MKRKPVMEDPAVKAAIKELRRVAMAVNGDEEVKSTLIMLDLKNGNEGSVGVFGDLCPCPPCLARMRKLAFSVFSEEEQDGVQQMFDKRVLHS